MGTANDVLSHPFGGALSTLFATKALCFLMEVIPAPRERIRRSAAVPAQAVSIIRGAASCRVLYRTDSIRAKSGERRRQMASGSCFSA